VRSCAVCGVSIEGRGPRALTCSARCRKALSRRTQPPQKHEAKAPKDDVPASLPAPPEPPPVPAVTLRLRPHIETSGESAGCHLDRFDAVLDGEVICVNRSGWHEPARKLLALGHSPETLLTVQHEGRPPDPTMVPRTIGELAAWAVTDNDRQGLRRGRWQPMPEEHKARLREQRQPPSTSTTES
jgi:hypothetical protein